MNRPRVELVNSPRTTGSISNVKEQRSGSAILAGFALLALAVAGSWAAHRELGRLLHALDGDALIRGAQVLDLWVEQQRGHAIAHVSLLAGDTRVRAAVITPTFDESTTRDALADLRKTSNAGALAVLDVSGRVQAVTGVDGLRGVDLGSSPVIKSALKGASADVWTLPDQVLVMGVAPVHSGERVSALFMMGFGLGEPVLGGIHRTLGVASAVFIGDRLVASSSSEGAYTQAFRMASGTSEDRMEPAGPNREFLARVTRTGTSANAGKVVWLVPRHHQARRFMILKAATWAPAVLVGLTFLILIGLRKAKGDAP
jgi:hypothetical protein